MMGMGWSSLQMVKKKVMCESVFMWEGNYIEWMTKMRLPQSFCLAWPYISTLCESILKYIHFFTSLLYFQMKPWGLGFLGGNQRCKAMRCHGAYTEKEMFQRKDPTPLFIHPFFFSLSSDYWEYNLSVEEESGLQKGKWTSRSIDSEERHRGKQECQRRRGRMGWV